MIRCLAGVSVALLLAGCSTQADKAEQRYDFLQNNGGTLGEVCDAGRAWQATLADAGQSGPYQMAKASVDIDCTSADLRGRGEPYRDTSPATEPDNMDALPDNAAAPEPAAARPAAVERVRADDLQEVPVCDRPDSASKRALMKEIGTDCLGE